MQKVRRESVVETQPCSKLYPHTYNVCVWPFSRSKVICINLGSWGTRLYIQLRPTVERSCGESCPLWTGQSPCPSAVENTRELHTTLSAQHSDTTQHTNNMQLTLDLTVYCTFTVHHYIHSTIVLQGIEDHAEAVLYLHFCIYRKQEKPLTSLILCQYHYTYIDIRCT